MADKDNALVSIFFNNLNYFTFQNMYLARRYFCTISRIFVWSFKFLVMRILCLTAIFLCASTVMFAQAIDSVAGKPLEKRNIYEIKKGFQYHVLHNPEEKHDPEEHDNEEHDNDQARFNRWFYFVQPRCYPTGDLPDADVLIRETQKVNRSSNAQRSSGGARRTTSAGWQPLGPMTVPLNSNGIGRINCVVIDPLDTNTLYVGAACGGVHISHNGGATWTTNTDNFPSLSIADIAVNPIHPDTLYAATGDGYGYTIDGYNTFWGGLYSAGVMKSTDGGNTWSTTGMTFTQPTRQSLLRLLINPANPNILLAAAVNGIYRTVDAGASWLRVYTAGPVYSLAFRPGAPDTVYGVNNTNLVWSVDGGATWSVLYAGINPASDRATIAVSPASPRSIWVLDADNVLKWSHDRGATFTATPSSPADSAIFYGYYDRVLAVSPTDSQFVLACGMLMTRSIDGGATWGRLNPSQDVHVDNHAMTFNPLHSATIYSGNDGGVFVTRNGGLSWQNISDGLTISQVYYSSASRQSPYTMIAGLQDNGSLTYNGSTWKQVGGNDGMNCAISPINDSIQVFSYQFGDFYMSHDRGNNFNYINIAPETGNWTSPVVCDPNNVANIYFGLQHIHVTHDTGATFSSLNTTANFPGGALCLAIGASNSQVLYASDQATIYRTTDAGASWTNVTGTLPGAIAITRIAVDPRDAMRVYVTMSGYLNGKKVYMSTTGGTTWTNISMDLPNLPADCIAVDTSLPGALFVGTDIGVYYTDSLLTGWHLYDHGLPNVIVDDIQLSYANSKVRAATFGRGIWETDLRRLTLGPGQTKAPEPGISIFPNPTTSKWQLRFAQQKPGNFEVRVSDINGRLLSANINTEIIDASSLASGVYNIEVIVGDDHHSIKAIRK